MFQIKLRVGTIFKVYLFIYCILNRRKKCLKDLSPVLLSSCFCWWHVFSHPSCSPDVFADGRSHLGYICPCCVTFLLTAQFWGISIRAASHFCWQPSFGVYLSVLCHVFADGLFLGYICPCCVTFLLTAQFCGIPVRAASCFCWWSLFETINLE